jgi:hypothetical protein
MKKNFTKEFFLFLSVFFIATNGFAQLTGVINVGTGQTYTTLTGSGGLFDAINTGTVTGNLTAQITSDITEPGTFALNKWVESGVGNYQIRIVPDGITERILSGSGTNMINLSNVRNLVIDGSFSGAGKFLRFANTNTAANTLAFLNDCKSDTIKNCYFEGKNTTTNKSVILIGTTNISGGTGNDSIVILNNIIKDNTAGIPNNLIRSVGTSALPNDNCIISGNEFINWSNEAMGLAAGTGDNWEILNNAFYQSSGTNITTNIYGIRTIANSGNGHFISGNSIGGSAPDRSGTSMTASPNPPPGDGSYTLIGISLSGNGSISNPVMLSNNKISNISTRSACGIYLTSVNASVDSNFVNNITVTPGAITIFKKAFGIDINSSTATITNNTIRKISSNLSELNDPTVAGINVSGTGNSYIIDHNIVDSIIGRKNSTNSNFTYSQIAVGISLSGTSSANVISNNKISNVINTSFGVAVGISVGARANVFNNQIDNVNGLFNSTPSTVGTYSILYGIDVSGSLDTLYNNIINTGSLTNSTTIIYGIRNTGGNVYYNNAVKIAAFNNESAGVGQATSFYHTNGSVLLRNNILINRRITGNISGPLTYRSVTIGNAASTGLNSDYNLLLGADSVCTMLGSTYKTFTDWKTASQGDSNSINGTVTFLSVTDLHIDGTKADAWNVYERGIAIPTVNTDIDGDNRSTVMGTHITIGADEIPIPTSTPLAIDLKTIAAKNVGNKNRIDWSTAKETKADYFELENSTDARNFKKIAIINAKGQPSVYTYWDEKAVLGMNYYRLRMTLGNGSFIYSKTVSAEVKSLSGFAISAYPNPVQNKVVLKIDGSIQNSAIITIINVAGKILQTLDVTKNEMEIDMKNFAAGIYFIKYTDEQQNQTVKITKQ